MPKDIQQDEEDKRANYYEYEQFQHQNKSNSIDIKSQKVSEYQKSSDNLPPLSKSAPSKSYMEEQPLMSGRRKKTMSDHLPSRRYSLHDELKNESTQPINKSNNTEEIKRQQNARYTSSHQRPYSEKRSYSYNQNYYNDSSIQPPLPIRMDQLSLQDIHQLIDENQTLRYQIEQMDHQNKLTKLEYQRRIRHLTARVQYLEMAQSPNECFNGIKPYHNGKKHSYKRRNKHQQNNNLKDDDTRATPTSEKPYLTESSDTAIPQIYSENNSAINNKRHFPFRYDSYPRNPVCQYGLMDSLDTMVPPSHMFPSNYGHAYKNRHMFPPGETPRDYGRFYENSPEIHQDFLGGEGNYLLDDEGNPGQIMDSINNEDAMNELYLPRFGTNPYDPPLSLAMHSGHPSLHPPPVPLMSGPHPMMYSHPSPWVSPHPEIDISRHSSLRSKDKNDKFINQSNLENVEFSPEDNEIEMMMQHMSLPGPPPHPNMMSMPHPMYGDFGHHPAIKHNRYNQNTLRRIPSRRSLPADLHQNRSSSRLSYMANR